MSTGFCRDCFTGRVLEDAVLTGFEQEVHGLPTYVTGPSPDASPSRGVVVIIPDAFGWSLNNTRALADAYARRVPCTVYVPDFMAGNAVPAWTMANLDFRPPPTAPLPSRLAQRIWAVAQVVPSFLHFVYTCRQSVARRRIHDFLHAVRTSPTPPPAVAVAGFCWGGFYAVGLTHAGSTHEAVVQGSTVPLVDCAFTAHPSLLSIPRDIEKAVRPLSVANGEDDEFMGRKNMAVLRGLLEEKERRAAEEGRFEVVVYPGAKHGFAVRRDWEDAVQRGAKERSEDQAVRFFQRWMGGGTGTS